MVSTIYSGNFRALRCRREGLGSNACACVCVCVCFVYVFPCFLAYLFTCFFVFFLCAEVCMCIYITMHKYIYICMSLKLAANLDLAFSSDQLPENAEHLESHTLGQAVTG